MAKQTDTANLAISTLHNALMGLCNRTGHTPDAVFVGLLDYIIGYLNPSLTPEPIEGWKFDKKETPAFYEMFQMIVKLYCQEIPNHGWYDPFGDLYMSIHSSGGGKGQFFTPPCVCDVCSRTTIKGLNFGLPQLTKLRISFNGYTDTHRKRASHRYLFRKYGYYVEYGDNTVYYDEQTERRPIMEANAHKYGLNIQQIV